MTCGQERSQNNLHIDLKICLERIEGYLDDENCIYGRCPNWARGSTRCLFTCIWTTLELLRNTYIYRTFMPNGIWYLEVVSLHTRYIDLTIVNWKYFSRLRTYPDSWTCYYFIINKVLYVWIRLSNRNSIYPINGPKIMGYKLETLK